MKNLEPAARAEIVDALTDAGRKLLIAMRGAAPFRTGKLRAGLSFKVLPKSLKLKVGYIGKAVNRRLEYARVLHAGRGLKKRIDRRGRRIGVIQPNRFVYGPRTDIRRAINSELRAIWARILARSAT